MISCTRCGQQLDDDARFCTWCGARLPEPDEQAWLLDPDGPVWWRDSPETTRPPRNRTGGRIVLASVALACAIGGTTAAMLAARAAPSHHVAADGHKIGHKITDDNATPSPRRSTRVVPLPKHSTEVVPLPKEAAQGLSALLARSASDRSTVVDAAGDVRQCGPDLARDAQIFTSAVASRQQLLSRLAALSGASSLPAGMVQALTGAWQSSVQADQDYAAWAQDESSAGCSANGPDPNLAAALAPADQANADKMTFVAMWNPLATRYGLPTYSWNQL